MHKDFIGFGYSLLDQLNGTTSKEEFRKDTDEFSVACKLRKIVEELDPRQRMILLSWLNRHGYEAVKDSLDNPYFPSEIRLP